MQSVVFETKGTLDVRAITTFGINSKPNSKSPIGFFGTGLKYAIAVLVREGCNVVLWTEGRRITFHKKEAAFRDKKFDFIEMSEARLGFFPSKTQLPYTTELGKTWEMWQAFRELYSNTLDEDGETFLIEDALDSKPEKGNTRIVVEGEAFVHEFHEKDKTFLPDGLRIREDWAVQVIDRVSNHIYYRGMRVYDLKEPSLVTYNVLTPIDLTEDRTAKHPYYLDAHIRNAVVRLEAAEVVEKVLTAKEKTYEHALDFKAASERPSDTFVYVVKKLKQDKRAYNTTAAPYIRGWDSAYMSRQKAKHWTSQVIDAVERELWPDLVRIVKENTAPFLHAIEQAVPSEDELALIEPANEEREEPCAIAS